jgi:hypothetical protein
VLELAHHGLRGTARLETQLGGMLFVGAARKTH